MHIHPLSMRTVVIVAVIAVLWPAFTRVASSPLALLLLSPFLLLFLTTAFWISNVLLGHFLDQRQQASRGSSLSTAAQPFSFSTPAAWQVVVTRSQWSHRTPQSLSPLYPEYAVASAAVNDILIMVVRDLVLTWYKDISSSPSFPTAVSTILHDTLERLLARTAMIDISVLLVKRILPKVTAHIEQFRQSEIALRGAGLERHLTQSEELDLLLASRYGAKGEKLHPAIDNLSTTFTKQTEELHLRQLVDKALPFVLPLKEARSKILRIAIRDILACLVLYPLFDMLADPDFWNCAIDQVAGEVIHQQKLITKVRNVLEAQLPRPHYQLSTSISPSTSETITLRTNPRQFESFLRGINRYSSLLDARRLKSDIVGEIRRTRMLLANHEKEDWINGEKTEDVVAFLDRLYTAKRQVEQRIVVLGGEDDSKQPAFTDTGPKSGLTLRDVLGNSNSLSYFMEFMDRRNRSLLIQFWLTVESCKNPLESVDSGSSGEDDDAIQDSSDSATLQEDIAMIHDLYFSSPAPHPALACVSNRHIEAIRSFVQSEPTASLLNQKRVRRSVMLAQRQVELDMEHDFGAFERSELWFRAISEIDIGSKELPSDPSPVSTENRPLSSVFVRPPPKGPVPQFPQRSRSSLYSVESTESSKSDQLGAGSSSSSSTPRNLASNIEALMYSTPEKSAESSRAPLFDDPDDEGHQSDKAQVQRMAAIRAALTDIIAFEQLKDGPQTMQEVSDPGTNDSFPSSIGSKEKGHNAVFSDDNEDGGQEETSGENDVFSQLAAPGDLRLSYEIARLGNKILNLQSQDMMLDTLIKKAELTGDTQELRLLRKSKSSMVRELRQLKFQKLQYEQQEAANRLIPERTKVTIVSSTVGEENGKSVVRYLIEVQQLAPDGKLASGWVVARRYNEFLNMHNKLRERYGLVKNLDFPGKRLVTALSSSFVDTRKAALEKYLQNIITIPVVCESDELRTFLSRDTPFIASEQPTSSKSSPTFSSTGFVRTVYQSVAGSIDDMFFGPSMLDVMIQRLTRQAAEFAGIVGSGVHDEELVAQALGASGKASSEDTFLRLSGDLKTLEGETSTSTFSAPICDLVLAVFELNKKNNWLRRQAIVIILQQVLGGTIERKIRESVKSLLEEGRVMTFITMFRDKYWPGGKLADSPPPRTMEEKVRSQEEANRKLSALVPDLAANMIGQSNARRGARRIFAVLQNRRLNQHIVYTIVDEVFNALFPEAT